MELVGRHGELRRLAAHLVAGQQAAETVERRVLDRLRGRGRRKLLEPDHRAHPLVAVRAVPGCLDAFAADERADQFEQVRIRAADGLAGARHRPGQIALVAVGRTGGSGVDAVGVEVHQDLGQRAADGGHGPVARREVALHDPVKQCRGGVQLARQRLTHDLAAGELGFVREVAGTAGQAGPQRGQRRFAGGVVENGGHLVHEVVPGGAVGAPGGRQAFVREQDLLDPDDRFRVAQGGGPRVPDLVQPLAQLGAIAAGVGETVDMVDPHAVDQPFGVQAQHRLVSRLEHLRHFLAHPGQPVDVEEAAPVDLVGRGAPPGQAVGLPLQQVVEPRTAFVGIGVEGGDGGREAARAAGMHLHQALRPSSARRRMASRPPGPALAKRSEIVSSGPPAPFRIMP